ncbi:MAG: LytR C-terminal domain-containing protein [Gemmatimonadota bacterium]
MSRARRRKSGGGPDRQRGGEAGRGRKLVSAALFVALGLVGAFAASAIAGLWDDEPAETGLRALDVGEPDRSAIRIEVLNGAGTPGLARHATDRLRGAGFDVVYFGNARRFDHVRSVVIDRRGAGHARAVAAWLGIDSVATAVDPSLMLETTVILGSDWPRPADPDPGWRERIDALVGRDASADSLDL